MRLSNYEQHRLDEEYSRRLDAQARERERIDDQSIRSRRYSDDGIILIPAPSGRVAVLNRAYDICGWVASDATIAEAMAVWRAPIGVKREAVTLEELGL